MSCYKPLLCFYFSYLHWCHHVPESIRSHHQELVPCGQPVILDLGHDGQVGRGVVVPGGSVGTQDWAQGLLDGLNVPLEAEVTESPEWGQVA